MWKKFILPIVISIIVTLYYVAYFAFLITMLDTVWKYILCILPVTVAIVMVKVCIDRIKEIKGGETDDLSKY
jgi:hypothetical protein